MVPSLGIEPGTEEVVRRPHGTPRIMLRGPLGDVFRLIFNIQWQGYKDIS